MVHVGTNFKFPRFGTHGVNGKIFNEIIKRDEHGQLAPLEGGDGNRDEVIFKFAPGAKARRVDRVFHLFRRNAVAQREEDSQRIYPVRKVFAFYDKGTPPGVKYCLSGQTR